MVADAKLRLGPKPVAHSFAFVERLAKDLSDQVPLEVPGFPDVVLRVRKALEDPNCDASAVATIISAEPVLTARLLRLANSAALQAGAGVIKDPQAAVSRLGFALVRSATISFAMEQMRIAYKYEAAKKHFDAIWRRSTHVAAISYVLAKRCTKLKPDEALLTGLMHGIGKLYILSRAQTVPDLFEHPDELNAVLANWHVATGESILQHWGFPEDLVAAIAVQEEVGREPRGPPDLGHILYLAVLLPDVLNSGPETELTPEAATGATRIGLSGGACASIIDESVELIAGLMKALG